VKDVERYGFGGESGMACIVQDAFAIYRTFQHRKESTPEDGRAI
jgi:hypothetical protein